jgi:signal transduction histidine kinase
MPEGQPVTAEQLPLIQALLLDHSVERRFVLVREGMPDLYLLWSATPQKEKGSIVGVFGSIYSGPKEPDWKVMAGLAHDLSTPLNALNLLASLIDRQCFSDADLRESLGDMRAAIGRALEVGNELLSYCRRPAAKETGLKTSWFELEPFIEGLLREQLAAAQEKNLTLTTSIAPARGWEVKSDRARLGRLLSNLIVNAIRYTYSGGVHVTAEWRMGRNGKTLFLGVVDTGTGIPSDEQESIFQPFERGHATREDDSGGSGLGLAVVDNLKEELGLELKVESEFGRGSAFFLLLPEPILRQSRGSSPVKISGTPADTV